jgi:hypothetical protein
MRLLAHALDQPHAETPLEHADLRARRRSAVVPVLGETDTGYSLSLVPRLDWTLELRQRIGKTPDSSLGRRTG